MASKRAERRRTCQGKVHHATLEDAENARRGTRVEGLDIYKCTFCGRGYVLGHRIGFRADFNRRNLKG